MRLKLTEENPVTVWQPYSEGRLLSGFAIPISGPIPEDSPMTEERYKWALEDRLHQLINEDPEKAEFFLTASPEHNPDLYWVARWNPIQDWPIQIMMCDQMHIRLSSIDWERGEYVTIPSTEVPGLQELIEVI